MADLRVEAPEPGRPRVVMMAGNDIVPDVRVLKYAHTVAGFGLDVIAVGIGGPRLTGRADDRRRTGHLSARDLSRGRQRMAAPAVGGQAVVL